MPILFKENPPLGCRSGHTKAGLCIGRYPGKRLGRRMATNLFTRLEIGFDLEPVLGGGFLHDQLLVVKVKLHALAVVQIAGQA